MFKKLKERKAATLLKAFNAAAGVMEGLDALKAEPGSSVDYTVGMRGTSVVITTNIPATYSSRDGVTVVSTGHRLIAQGDVLLSRTGAVSHTTMAGNDNPGKIVKFVKNYAQEKGMMP